jgi:hypothetical protein
LPACPSSTITCVPDPFYICTEDCTAVCHWQSGDEVTGFWMNVDGECLQEYCQNNPGTSGCPGGGGSECSSDSDCQGSCIAGMCTS